jgi:FkbH-like protein
VRAGKLTDVFEFDKYDARLHDAPLSGPTHPYEPAKDVARVSLLMWGEHCTECAAPACYLTCDLYESRPDTRCRRFVYGAYKNENFPSLRGYGVEISFKKWARLEARGNTTMQPVEAVLREEQLLAASTPWVSRAGDLVRLVTGDDRWSYAAWAGLERVSRRLQALSERTPRCDAFLLEVYNPTETPFEAQVAISVAKPEIARMKDKPDVIPHPFVAKVTFAPGYSRHEFEARLFQRITTSGLPFDVCLTPAGDTTARLVFLTADFVVFERATSERGTKAAALPNVKCIVWDLDNTLWQGTLLENPQVELTPGIEDVIKQLDHVGILHTIASKNDHENAWQRLTELGLSEYFLHSRINWQPKSTNIRQIAADLDLGLDTFAFVDDNPFELEEVSRALGMVTCINVGDLTDALAGPRFAGSQTADAKNRRHYYKDEIVRSQRQVEFGSDYRGFLASCEIELEIRTFAPGDLERVSELVQRTNQLNFSGRKYKREELVPLLADPSLEKLVCSCTDRFGSYGVVGFGMVRREDDEIRIEDFMLSCRVQGKLIEQAFFDHLTCTPAGDYRRIWVNFTATTRNTPARQVLDSLRFAASEGEPGLSLDLAEASLACDFIKVTRLR